MLIRAMSFVSLALALPLAGCGGSSGSGSPATSPPAAERPMQPMSLSTAVANQYSAQTAAMAAGSTPRPGSVTQSSNIDSATGATADRVDVTIDNGDFTITQDGGPEEWEVSTSSAEPLSEALGLSDGIGMVSREDGGQRIVIAYGRTPEEGNTDWLAAGIWAFVPDSGAPADYEFGAFADGGDPFEQGNLLALTGTATYNGRAVGVFYANAPDGDEAGPFGADVALTADFGGASEPGSIQGTVSNVVTQAGSLGATLNLGSAPIGGSDSGFFTGATSMDFEERTYTGQWGGQFFGNGTTADAPPSAVAGTFGATTSDGTSTGSLVGAFGAERLVDQ